MNHNIGPFLGYIVILLLKSSTFTVNGHSCQVISSHRELDMVETDLFINCSSLLKSSSGFLRFIVVPTDLDPNVESLDLSYNAFNEMNETIFKRYPKIRYLSLLGTKVVKFAGDSFRPLTKLTGLYISAFSINIGAIEYLPPNIRFLKYCERRLQLKLTDFSNLEYADVCDSNLNVFPNFDIKAPLKTVDISGNPMGELTVNQIAPYCRLTEIKIELKSNSPLLTESKYCECSRLNVWMNQFDIKHEPLKCKSSDFTCDKEFSEDTLLKRRQCIEAETRPYNTNSSRSNKMVFIVIAFILFLILLMLVMAFRYVKRRNAVPIESADSAELAEPVESNVPAEPSPSENENVVEEELSE